VEEVEYGARMDECCEVHLVVDGVGSSVYEVPQNGWKVFYDRFACIEDHFNGTVVCFDLTSKTVQKLIRCEGVYAKLDMIGSVIAMVVEPVCGGVTLEVFSIAVTFFFWSFGIEGTVTFCLHMKLINRDPFMVFSDEEVEEEEEEERDACVDNEKFFALCCSTITSNSKSFALIITKLSNRRRKK
jgi:hypothetical protein